VPVSARVQARRQGFPKQEQVMLHHIEIHVAELARSVEFWGWLLPKLGYRVHQDWSQGRSWVAGETYVVFVQVEARFRRPGFHRRRTGLNHLAFHATSRAHVDALTGQLRERGIAILYEDRHPFAGGPGHYAVFFEDPDRIKVEVVAPEVASATAEFAIRDLPAGRGAVCERILRSLPAWFGIERAIHDYVRAVEDMPTWVAEAGGETVGFLSLEVKNDWVAEIHVMGVRSEWHGRGCGARLLETAEAYAHRRGLELLMVKTLGPSHPDEGYARTRRFYLARGFRPLEEFHGVWDPGNPCLVMAKRVSPAAPRS
jgi:catechol 2,3-dioxygenase-like lactoylglutathione lyase family enzyme/GNAT superfamily N-acetyltransferase